MPELHEEPKTHRYKLLRGSHAEQFITKNEDGEKVVTEKVYEAGTKNNIIETDKDLLKHNHPAEPKFEKIS